MDSTTIHVCMETPDAPSVDGHEVGDRWVCSCGDTFIYREGFNRAGYPSLEWWVIPNVPQPREAKPKARRGLLFGPRKG
jgi:hypothetical protein